MRHRPEIDGLRALAVSSVLLFHAGLGMPGGFVGVDVFFVISGFLITSIILKEVGSGNFSFPAFWERRARRILPASVLTVLATLVAGWFLLLPDDFRKLGASALWQTGFAANLYFWRSTNYFAIEDTEPPLLHTWSLSIEEQFYFLFPLALILAYRLPIFRASRWLIPVLLAGFVASLALSIWFLPRSPAGTFYLLPSRAWELLAGALLAALPLPPERTPRWWREVLGWLAVALILAPCFLYDKKTPFPALAALPPCLGATLFIWIFSRRATASEQTPLTSVERVFSWRPVVFTGLISYSLYLWHWPLFAFASYTTLGPIPLPHRLALVVATFVLAWLSWAFIEQPFRSRRLARSRAAMARWAIAGLAMPAAFAALVVRGDGFAHRFPPRLVELEASKVVDVESPGSARSSTLEDARRGSFPRLGTARLDRTDLMVWGDSHARSILPALDAMAAEKGKSVQVAWYSSTPPVLGYTPEKWLFSLREEAVPFNQAVLDHIRLNRVPTVLLAARWSTYLPEEPAASDQRASEFARQLTETVRKLKELRCRVWILAEVPSHHVNVPKALIHKDLFGTNLEPFRSDPSHLARISASFSALMPELHAAGATIIDVQHSLLDSSSNRFLMEQHGQPLYTDTNHLSRLGASLLCEDFAPLFDP